MSVTVGIATTGEHPGVLRETVRRALLSAARTGDDAEVLVVVNGRGHVPELEYLVPDRLRVVYRERRNVAEARNAILDAARHDTVLYTDDDCLVPPEWATQLASALHEPGCVATAAPVRMEIEGPISAYFDYQRLFDAAPSGVDIASTLVTTNCGVRRDLLPAGLRFNPTLASSGEDTDFSLALGRAGLAIRWLGDATPLRHGLSEDIGEVVERHLRNGRGAAHLFLRHGRQFTAMPDALGLYRSRIEDGFPADRRYGEFLLPEARIAFAVYDLMHIGAIVVGYLDGVATEVGESILDLDLAGLRAAWRGVADRVREITDPIPVEVWRDLRVDYGRIGESDERARPFLSQVRAALRRYARPPADNPLGPVGDVLAFGAGEQVGDYMEGVSRLWQAWRELCAAGPVTPDGLNRTARRLGVPFKVAVDGLELSKIFNLAGVAQHEGSAR